MKAKMNFLKALLARGLFAIHGIITIWRVTEVNSEIYYLLVIPVCLVPVEMITTLKFADDGEWKWFCPSVLLYLASVVPGLWLLQFDLYDKRIAYRESMGWTDCSGDFMYNETSLSFDVVGFNLVVPVTLSDEDWAVTLEQVLIILLILGRWLLPKGSLTRDQLSQLLLVYIAMGADILEFFGESLGEETVICNRALITVILLIWSWSLGQFTLVRTSVSAAADQPAAKRRRKSVVSGVFGGCCGSEIWTLCIAIVMQDGPFLIVRLYLIIVSGTVNQLMLFFTVKNVVIISLQLYRIAILRFPGLCPGVQTDPDVEEGVPEAEPEGRDNEGLEVDDEGQVEEKENKDEQKEHVIGTEF
ncbi:transmembrane protein 26-like [Acanthaster planci]|uniref:Transmembrane protein 26-like n=1 Tax=Acanthaster planci TaxID=133434 RepID=A0A8B7YVL5_ACAPL|nr:transmembrane protein 26-like [Acanthaster planci]